MRYIIASLLLLFALPLAADEQKEANKLNGIPAWCDDEAFDRFFDPTYLGEAWQELDPSRLADSGMQLAEGERSLQRSHKVLTAERVLSYAIKLAGQQGDGETLTRIARSQAMTVNPALAEQLIEARKKAGKRELRAIAAPQSAGDALFHAMWQDITDARLTGSAGNLRLLRKVLDGLPELSASQRMALQRALQGDPPAVDDATRLANRSLRVYQMAWQHTEGKRPHILRTVTVLDRLRHRGDGPAQALQQAVEAILELCPPGMPDC